MLGYGALGETPLSALAGASNHWDLVVADASHSHTADTPTLAQNYVGTSNNTSQLQTSDSPSLVQHYVLTVADTAHVLSSDSPTVVEHQHWDLTVADCSQLQKAREVYYLEWDHETGNTSQYEGYFPDSGDAVVDAVAALAGTNYGVKITLDDGNLKGGYKYLPSTMPKSIRWRFYIDPNSSAWSNGNYLTVSYINGTTLIVIAKLAYYATGGWTIVTWAKTDAGGDVGGEGYCRITDAPHYIEIRIQGATSSTSNDGIFEWWVDGVFQKGYYAVDNYDIYYTASTYFVLGANDWNGGSVGTIYLDEMVLRLDEQEIGPYSASPTPNLIQHYVLSADASTHVLTSDNVTLGIDLIAQDSSHAHTAESPVVTYHAPTTNLTVQDSPQAQTADSPTLVQHYILSVSDSSHILTSDSPALVQHYTITVSDSAHALTSDSVTVGLSVIVANSTHTLTSDQAGLGVGLTVSDAIHSLTSDSPIFVVDLIVSDSSHSQTSEQATIVEHPHWDLTVADSSHIHSVENVGLGVGITVSDSSQLHSSDSPSLVQHYVLTVDNSTHTHTVDSPILGVGLVVSNSTQPQTSESPTLTQHNTLEVSNATQSISSGFESINWSENTFPEGDFANDINSWSWNSGAYWNTGHAVLPSYYSSVNRNYDVPVVGEIQNKLTLWLQSTGLIPYTIMMNGWTSKSTIINISNESLDMDFVWQKIEVYTTPLMSENASFSVTAEEGGQGSLLVDNISWQYKTGITVVDVPLTQYNILVVNDTNHLQTSDNVTLVQHYTLTVNDTAHVLTSDECTVTYHPPGAVVLEIAGDTLLQSSDTASLVQHGAISVSDTAHAQYVDNTVLVQHYVLSVADVTHALTSETPTVSAKYSVTVSNASQLHTADTVTVTVGGALAVSNSTQLLTSDIPTLIQHYTLVVNDSSHLQTVENVSLVMNLVVNDSSHLQTSDNPSITQHNGIIVSDSTQSHAVESKALTQHNVLLVNDSLQNLTSSDVVIVEHTYNSLVVDNSQHTITSDEVELKPSLVIFEANQQITSDNVDLVQHNAIVVYDATQAINSTTIDLTPLMVLMFALNYTGKAELQAKKGKNHSGDLKINRGYNSNLTVSKKEDVTTDLELKRVVSKTLKRK